ncbi:AtzE family amidohydrolase [Spirulina major CS-329]|uniref:AtzE family amidohydrolase n=1 Tax=Spirulina TaxID=1154 RepID=UPI00232C1EAD|nr:MULTISPECIES: AtzE family amidohydrolase [Spirulina]MDB9493306.1 AtzE family amidohydrolase [Spirulina subsalsa CS-330]MDB9504500.1 AtzE family amidohydrolase [Spirulina major CS-329]
MTLDLATADAVAIARAVQTQQTTVEAVVQHHLAQIHQRDPGLNCFTAVLADQALLASRQLDHSPHPRHRWSALSGVPFAVKNLFDIAGVTTLAGAKINAEDEPAGQDATVITRLKHAGGILLGALNMDEYAYGFVTENTHYGSTHNPHDPERVAGGSSGGSAAAVAAGFVPISLGSDTNGSVRVPAALCGVYGLKPTFGRLSRAGTVLFSSSLDHIGVMARSVRDVATVFDFLQGDDVFDPVCSRHPPDPVLPQLNLGLQGIRIAQAGDYFQTGADPEIFAAVAQVAAALEADAVVTLPETERARAAAMLITAAEGATHHLANLRSRAHDFDPATRDRFLTGTILPAAWYIQSQRFRRWYRNQVRRIFRDVDVIVAPTTPCVAPRLGQLEAVIGGQTVDVRPYLGRFTQPLSFIGLPVLTVPVVRDQGLPIGVQLMAAPYNEAYLLRVAASLERQGVIAAPVATYKEF